VGGDASASSLGQQPSSSVTNGTEYGGQLTPMDVLRSQGDIGTPYKHHPALVQSTSSVHAFPLHKRGNAPKAQELYPSMREASFFTTSNSQNLSFASLDDDARYWSSPRRGFKFYRHERKTTAAEIMQREVAGASGNLLLDTDTSYKAGVARRVADQTPYAQYGAMRSSVARLPNGGASDVVTSTPHAVGPGSYEHGGAVVQVVNPVDPYNLKARLVSTLEPPYSMISWFQTLCFQMGSTCAATARHSQVGAVSAAEAAELHIPVHDAAAGEDPGGAGQRRGQLRQRVDGPRALEAALQGGGEVRNGEEAPDDLARGEHAGARGARRDRHVEVAAALRGQVEDAAGGVQGGLAGADQPEMTSVRRITFWGGGDGRGAAWACGGWSGLSFFRSSSYYIGVVVCVDRKEPTAS
jgi:hypothetical protein